MKNIIKDSLILFAITLVAGLLLGTAYELTKNPRARQAEKKQNEAYISVLEDYIKYDKKFTDFKDIDFKKVDFEDINLDKLTVINNKLTAAGLSASVVTVESAVVARDSESNVIGYAVTVTSKEGYGGDIRFVTGFNKEGAVTGISILSIGETPGLGMNADSFDFIKNYVGKTGGEFVVNKDATNDSENVIDAISGATITSRAMTKGVNAAYITMQTILESNNGGESDEK